MSNELHHFSSERGATSVSLPFSLPTMLHAWHDLRTVMAKKKPDAFSREEWAYLILFLAECELRAPFERAFGTPLETVPDRILRLARPRATTAVWLPSNVSLLGPLTVILLTLTGTKLRLKCGSRNTDLAGIFLDFACENAKEPFLRDYLRANVEIQQFDRKDPRNLAMAALANVRVVFGSDEAALAIHALPHPAGSIGITFGDRVSETWIEPDLATDATLISFLKVFLIYGRTGCTSPRRLVVIDGTPQEATRIAQRLGSLAETLIKKEVPASVASNNFAATQVALAQGWDVVRVASSGITIASGEASLPEVPGDYTLTVTSLPLAGAKAALPKNIQTIGHAVADPGNAKWLDCLAGTAATRFVPLEKMHYFGPVWDGRFFWQECFEFVECQ